MDICKAPNCGGRRAEYTVGGGKVMKKNCGTCRHWERTGTEDSGLMMPDGSEKWVYAVGQCHSNECPVGYGNNIACWRTCEHWQRGGNKSGSR
jgi:hypothetical protein